MTHIFQAPKTHFASPYLNHADQPMDISIYDDEVIVYKKDLENTFGVNEALSVSKLKSRQLQSCFGQIGKKAYGYIILKWNNISMMIFRMRFRKISAFFFFAFF